MYRITQVWAQEVCICTCSGVHLSYNSCEQEVTGERNALVEAARTGDVETVARMLGMGQEPTLGETIIPWASRPQQMTRLVNGRETGGHFCTPMIAAVVEGQVS